MKLLRLNSEPFTWLLRLLLDCFVPAAAEMSMPASNW